MTMESDLTALLKTICPRVFPDIAPAGTVTPYVTWQGIGGASLRMLDGTAGDKRNTYMQISVWAKTRAESLALIRSAESSICAAMIAQPEGEPVSTYEFDTLLYGCIQRFSIWSPV